MFYNMLLENMMIDQNFAKKVDINCITLLNAPFNKLQFIQSITEFIHDNKSFLKCSCNYVFI